VKRLFFALFPCCVALLCTGHVRAGEDSSAAALRALLADDWEHTLRADPLFATSIGDHRFDALLPEVSEANETRERLHDELMLERLRGIDRESLSEEERNHYDIFALLKTDAIAERDFRTYLTPISSRSGFHIQFPRLRKHVVFDSARAYESYLARLSGFLEYARGHIALMRRGIELGYVLPRVVLEGFETTITAHIVAEPTESVFFEPFRDFPAQIDSRERKRLREEAVRAVSESIVPGYREFLRFMVEEYVPAARPSIAAADLPDGRRFYEHRVRRFTTLPLTPRAVHDTGQAEVRRIRTEMEAIVAKVDFEGSFAEFLEFLRTDKRFYAATPEALLKEVSFILKRMDGKLPLLFKTLPRTPYGLEPIPDYLAPKTTSAYYNPPAGDGSRPGIYSLNTYDLPSRPLYELEALSLHEAVPGHHLQIALQQELASLPAFRRFERFTAFVEGWALYAERLGLEVDFYTDPYSDFGRLTFEMWRACRLVVDTGMHYFGWSRERAIEFMAANTALTRLNIRNEVDRYISWPGQALAYKIGELKIRELRAFAEEALGEGFDVRVFHDQVLGRGAVPLSLLEEQMRAWVAAPR
jgi:uncharacterized protein (DUF885 family)